MAHLAASVVWIRDGKTHELKDKKAILAGLKPLMTGDKVFVDVNYTDDQGNDLPDFAPSEMSYELGYSGKTDITFSGAEIKELFGDHFRLGGQGLRKLADAKGQALIFALDKGTPGSSNSYFLVKAGGLTSEIQFPYTD